MPLLDSQGISTKFMGALPAKQQKRTVGTSPPPPPVIHTPMATPFAAFCFAWCAWAFRFEMGFYLTGARCGHHTPWAHFLSLSLSRFAMETEHRATSNKHVICWFGDGWINPFEEPISLIELFSVLWRWCETDALGCQFAAFSDQITEKDALGIGEMMKYGNSISVEQ